MSEVGLNGEDKHNGRIQRKFAKTTGYYAGYETQPRKNGEGTRRDETWRRWYEKWNEEKKQGQDKMKNRIEETKTEIKEEMWKGQ